MNQSICASDVSTAGLSPAAAAAPSADVPAAAVIRAAADDEDAICRPSCEATLRTTDVTTEWAASAGKEDSTEADDAEEEDDEDATAYEGTSAYILAVFAYRRPLPRHFHSRSLTGLPVLASLASCAASEKKRTAKKKKKIPSSSSVFHLSCPVLRCSVLGAHGPTGGGNYCEIADEVKSQPAPLCTYRTSDVTRVECTKKRRI